VHFNFSESEMAHYRLIASGLNMSIDAPKRSRKRKQTLTRVVKQLAKAGVVDVARVEISVDGTIGIVVGKSEITAETAANPWDEVYTRGKH